MGVKSTVKLTRAEAELRLAAFMLAGERRTLEEVIAKLGNSELEDALERANDLTHDGEGFENYLIEEKPQ